MAFLSSLSSRNYVAKNPARSRTQRGQAAGRHIIVLAT